MRYSNVTGVGKSIVLIGMMGAGKSSVGGCLHRRTGLALHDTDEIVASNFGMSISEIFAEHGEKKFREAETEALRSLPTEEQTIIVTGGGIVLRNENVEILKRLGCDRVARRGRGNAFCEGLPETEQTIAANEKPEKVFLGNPWCPQTSLRKHRGHPGRYLGTHG